MKIENRVQFFWPTRYTHISICWYGLWNVRTASTNWHLFSHGMFA